MQEEIDAFSGRGARVVAIGQGSGAEADALARRLSLSFPCLGDPGHAGYDALGLGRTGWWGLLGQPFVEDFRGAMRNLREADLAASAGRHADVKRLGGSMVVARGGRIAHLHRAERTDDLCSNAQLLRVLDAL